MSSAQTPDALRAFLSEFYGRRITKTSDLAEGACCTLDTSARFREVVPLLPKEVVARQYGCGSPIPEDELTGLTCLDLGCGAGFDAFVLARQVGASGFVHGLDMTAEQLDVARRAAPLVADRFGYTAPNVAFHEGFVETADAIADGSVDLVISNCVINLSPAKDQVFRTIHRVLKEGGELYVADVVADRRVPASLAGDPALVAECLGGAQYEHDLFDTMKDAGFADPRVVSRKVLRRDVKGEPINFYSLIVRAPKLTHPPLDRRCEDYGQVVTYRGTIDLHPARYAYDDHHVFERGRPTPVCRNTARMLSETRLARHFDVTPASRHFGPFACGPAPASAGGAGSAGGACC